MGDIVYILLLIVVVVAVLVTVILSGKKQKAYLEAQRANNTDKQAMLDLMARALGENYEKYTYAVGYYTKIKQKLNETIYYYFPYILAFTQEEMLIFPFIKENGNLFLRNHLAVDWKVAKFDYKLKKDGMTLTFKMVGETMPIHVDSVIKGGMNERSDRPLCVFQERECAMLKGYLEGYKRMSRG